MKRLQDVSPEDRPRERMLAFGPGALTDQELVALVLGTGHRDQSVLELASSILKCLDSGDSQPNLEQLQKIAGVGPVRAMKLAAAMEFARRRIRPTGLKIREPKDFVNLIRHFADRKQEHFICTSLNGGDEVIATRVVTVGLVDRSHVHPREVFAEPIKDRACAVILAHNHPSGSVRPSEGDRRVTERLVEAGMILGIRVRDHIVFTLNDYYSFCEQGVMPTWAA